MPEGLVGAGDPIVFAYVFFEPPSCKLPLFFSKPCRGSREIWQNKEGRESNDDGY
jgi:hypothetical protein